MRVLFVSDNGYLPQVNGGVEWSTHELCQVLPKRGVEVAVLASIIPRGSLGWINRLRRRSAVWGKWPADTGLGYPVFRGWNLVEGIVDIVQRWRPDRVVVKGSTPQLALRSKAMGIPSFFNFHHPLPNLPADGEWRNLDGFICCSPFLAGFQEARFGIRTEVVRPLVRAERCQTTVAPRVALFFGLQPIKGADLVLNLAASRPDIPFHLVETWTIDPTATANLKTKARALPNVRISSPVKDVKRFFQDARLLLVPSRWDEAWGRVVTEAQVNAIPALASNRGGLPETVGTGGICMDPDADILEWRQALSRFWDDEGYFRDMAARAQRSSARPELQEQAIVDALMNAIRA